MHRYKFTNKGKFDGYPNFLVVSPNFLVGCVGGLFRNSKLHGGAVWLAQKIENVFLTGGFEPNPPINILKFRACHIRFRGYQELTQDSISDPIVDNNPQGVTRDWFLFAATPLRGFSSRTILLRVHRSNYIFRNL